jgi:hypothetical protein
MAGKFETKKGAGKKISRALIFLFSTVVVFAGLLGAVGFASFMLIRNEFLKKDFADNSPTNRYVFQLNIMRL